MADEFIFDGPASIVEDKYNRSVEYADSALEQVEEFQEALRNSVYPPEQITARWESTPVPTLEAVPDIPTLPDISLELPSNVPGALTADLPDIDIEDFDGVAPTLDMPSAPELTIGTAPAIAEVRDVFIPDAPDVVLPDAPDFLTLNVQTFAGVDMHEDWLDKLDDVPTLDLVAPTPFTFTPGSRYTSALMETLKATLNARMAGGTGLNPVVENAIWGRALDRETAIALARELEINRQAEALGFPLPGGVAIGQRIDARREFHDKVSGLSRDISIKQAEMEQTNLQQAIQSTLQLETTFLEDAYKYEALAFDIAKVTADNAIQVHNAALAQFNGLLDGYRTYASVYQTLIQAEMNKVEVFKALLQAEQVKADINKSLVDRYTAEIEGRMAAVEIYKARVGAAQTLVELERTRVEASGEQIKAFVATISGETAKAELYKIRLEGEKTKSDVYGSQVQAYGLKVSAKASKARAEVDQFQAKVSAKALEWDGFRAQLSASVAVADAAAKKSSVIMDGYRIAASAVEATAMSYTRLWESKIKEYEAGKSIALQAAKANADAVQHANDVRVDIAKVGLATAAQQLAGAWTAVTAQASIQGSGQLIQTQQL
jgi:hypothetical protein